MSSATSSPESLMLRAARVLKKSFPVFGSMRVRRTDWTCASLRGMAGRGKRLSVPKSPLELAFSPVSDVLAQAFRHHRAALRERAVSHRAHHGVHPGRHLGAVPAHAGTRGAFRR